jgi:hypothetical protein
MQVICLRKVGLSGHVSLVLVIVVVVVLVLVIVVVVVLIVGPKLFIEPGTKAFFQLSSVSGPGL